MIYLKILKEKKVLYVEDDPIVQESTYQILKLFFNNITVANNGLEALTYKDVFFDIIILDLKLPYVNGMTVAKTFREKYADTLIMMISSYQETDDLREALKIGMIDYIPKPLKLEELQKALQTCAKKLQKDTLYKLEDGITYDFNNKTLFKEDAQYNLTKNEIIFIELLISHKGQLLTYDAISQEMFNNSNTDNNMHAIKNLVHRFKKKFDTQLLENVFGVGYRVR